MSPFVLLFPRGVLFAAFPRVEGGRSEAEGELVQMDGSHHDWFKPAQETDAHQPVPRNLVGRFQIADARQAQLLDQPILQ